MTQILYPTYVLPIPTACGDARAINWTLPLPAPACAGASLTGFVPTNTTGCNPVFFPSVITIR